MTFPRQMTRFNRTMINPVMTKFAGRFGPLAIVEHEGRSSGKKYRTPTLAFTTEEGFIIALIYGRNTDWERNVMNDGGCALIYHNDCHPLTNPRLIGSNEANRWLPAPIRLGLPLISVHDFLRLDRAQQA